MKRGLIGLCWLLGAGCVGGGAPDLSLGGTCNPTELGGCVKFDGTNAFADLYGYCADVGTPANDPLCEEPMQELGVTAEELADSYVSDVPCVEEVLGASDGGTERSMEEIQEMLVDCLSQDTHEGDSFVSPPRLNDEWTVDPDVHEGDSTHTGDGFNDFDDQFTHDLSGDDSAELR